jgi:hypothetical protein
MKTVADQFADTRGVLGVIKAIINGSAGASLDHAKTNLSR